MQSIITTSILLLSLTTDPLSYLTGYYPTSMTVLPASLQGVITLINTVKHKKANKDEIPESLIKSHKNSFSVPISILYCIINWSQIIFFPIGSNMQTLFLYIKKTLKKLSAIKD